MQTNRKLILSAQLAVSAVLIATSGALAQGPNDFFGSALPGASAATAAADAASPAPVAQEPNPYADTTVTHGAEFTDDEKRMQKKYKAKLKHAQSLILKGEKMMNKTKDSKSCKKGKIFKDIGERRLAELKANNPLKDLTAETPESDKLKTAQSEDAATQ